VKLLMAFDNRVSSEITRLAFSAMVQLLQLVPCDEGDPHSFSVGCVVVTVILGKYNRVVYESEFGA